MDKLPVEVNDPRFLFDIHLPIKFTEQKNLDINWKIEKTKELISKKRKIINQEHIHSFNNNYIPLDQFDWIDNNDTVMNYFIWHICLMQKSSSNNSLNILSFNFDEIFPLHIYTNINFRIPEFNIDSKKLKDTSIVLIHAVIRRNSMNIQKQYKLINLIKNKYHEFKKSNFFIYTLEENKERANWFLKTLNKDNVNLPSDISTNEKIQRYALATCLFFWNKNSPYTSPFYNENFIYKSEFIHKINLKWNQHSHRKLNKKNKVKAYNFEMSTDIAKKLNELSKYHDKKKNALVQSLIEQAYDDMKRK